MLNVEQSTEHKRNSYRQKFPLPKRPRKITYQVACGQFVQVAKEVVGGNTPRPALLPPPTLRSVQLFGTLGYLLCQRSKRNV